MRSLLVMLVATLLQADFYLVDDERRVKMQEVDSTNIDISALSSLPFIERKSPRLRVINDEPCLDLRHPEFLLTSIDLIQTKHTLEVFTDHSEENLSEFSFGNIEVDDGLMLQVTFHGHWYAIVLGEPLKVLHDLFSHGDIDPSLAYDAVVKARVAYPEDFRLILYEKKWRDAYLFEEQSRKALRIEQDFARYNTESDQAMSDHILTQIDDFEKRFPDSTFHKKLFKIKEVLKRTAYYKEI